MHAEGRSQEAWSGIANLPLHSPSVTRSSICVPHVDDKPNHLSCRVDQKGGPNQTQVPHLGRGCLEMRYRPAGSAYPGCACCPWQLLLGVALARTPLPPPSQGPGDDVCVFCPCCVVPAWLCVCLPQPRAHAAVCDPDRPPPWPQSHRGLPGVAGSWPGTLGPGRFRDRGHLNPGESS